MLVFAHILLQETHFYSDKSLSQEIKMSEILLKLIQLKKINDNLTSLKKKFNTSIENVLNFDSINNSVIDCIKDFRCDLKIIGSKQKSKKFKCLWPKCQFKTKYKEYLGRHKSVHSNERPFVCDLKGCEKRDQRKGDLKEHKRKVHLKERQFKCNYNNCEKKFFKKSELEKHKCIHSGIREKRYVCDHKNCGKKFNTNSHLDRHKRCVHLKERNYNCDYNNCEKKFFSERQLKSHKIIHSKENIFICDHKNCGKRFTEKTSLNLHKRLIHLNVRQIHCDYKNCEKKFFIKSGLRVHKLIHTREEPFV
jgi:uncharacterized Zn-finger protein